MGARAATIWFSDVADPKGRLAITGASDETPARAIAERILGNDVRSRPNNLAAAADAPLGRLFVGSYGGLTVVTHAALAIAKPSELDASWLDLVRAAQTFLLVTQPERSIGAFAHWSGDELKRSFSAHPVDIIEDIGLPETFERPFWAGEHPLAYAPGVTADPRALPFHPMEFAEQANREWLGFRYTHPLDDTDLDPARIPVLEFWIADDSETPDLGAAAHDASVGAEAQDPWDAARPVGGTHPGVGAYPSASRQQGDWGPGPENDYDEARKGKVRRWFGF